MGGINETNYPVVQQKENQTGKKTKTPSSLIFLLFLNQNSTTKTCPKPNHFSPLPLQFKSSPPISGPLRELPHWSLGFYSTQQPGQSLCTSFKTINPTFFSCSKPPMSVHLIQIPSQTSQHGSQGPTFSNYYLLLRVHFHHIPPYSGDMSLFAVLQHVKLAPAGRPFLVLPFLLPRTLFPQMTQSRFIQGSAQCDLLRQAFPG